MMEHDTLFDSDWSDNFKRFLSVENCNVILEVGSGNGMWTSTISRFFQGSMVIATEMDAGPRETPGGNYEIRVLTLSSATRIICPLLKDHWNGSQILGI